MKKREYIEYINALKLLKNYRNKNIDLKSLFPNSNIITLKNVSKKIEGIKNLLIENNDLIVYKNSKYYSYEDNNIISMNQKETCKKIKKILKQY